MKYLFPLLFLLGLSSCLDDGLELANPNQQTVQQFWSDADGAERGLTAIYATFPKPGGLARWFYFLTDLRSDEGYSVSPWIELQNSTKFILVNYNFVTLSSVWADHYTGIYRANQVIANVPTIEMDAGRRDAIVAEAKFLRAYFYFNLVSLYGNVPLVLEPNRLTGEVPYSPAEANWAQIEVDLRDAMAVLPVSYQGGMVGRPTRGAAKGLLGKVYMQLHQYDEALTEFSYHIDGEGSAEYGLMDDYADNFRHTTEYNIESVFEVSFSNLIAGPPTEGEDVADHSLGNNRAQFFAPRGIGWSDGQCRRWVAEEFNKERTVDNQRDPRLAVTVLYDSTDVRGPELTNVYGQTFQQRFPGSDEAWFHKYQNDYWRDFENYHSPINLRVIRFADVLLMYAEALNATGRTEEAYQYVDRVRQRAGMASLSDIRPGMSQEEFLEQLQHERVVELAGESTRWNDLVRWGLLDDPAEVARIAARDPDFENFQVNRDKLLPIPRAELDINSALEQNEGF